MQIASQLKDQELALDAALKTLNPSATENNHWNAKKKKTQTCREFFSHYIQRRRSPVVSNENTTIMNVKTGMHLCWWINFLKKLPHLCTSHHEIPKKGLSVSGSNNFQGQHLNKILIYSNPDFSRILFYPAGVTSPETFSQQFSNHHRTENSDWQQSVLVKHQYWIADKDIHSEDWA